MLELSPNEINEYQLYKINKWTKGEIIQFKKLIEKNVIDDIDNILKTIYEYKIPFNSITSLDSEQLHRIGIKNFFNKKNNSRKIKELLKEHNEILKEKQLPLNSNQENLSISQKVDSINELTRHYSHSNITKKNIPEDLKYKNEDLIAIVNNAIIKIKHFPLRDSQIYSLLVLLNKEQNRGKIAQILTGEGKTLIIISLAIIMVLKGHKVDIVTSNPLLAKRDSEESKELFEYFGITVGNNIDSPETLQIFKKLMNIEKDDVYTKDVIYGTTFEYQGDILKDEYELSGIRRNRGFDIVIVDEIDCMLIDEYASKTRLAKSKPFLEKYSIFLYLLWSFYKDIALEYNLDEDKIAEDQETREKLSEYLTNKIKKFINIENENSKYYFPMSQMNKQFALNQVDKWVNNLINCLKMKQNVECIIKDNDIVPVDQDNTGVIQKSVTLSQGLHQFLQMKENLPVTPLSITTNYLSNLGFFKRYINSNNNNIYGMTGTLGSKKSRELLGEVYDLDFDYIPPDSNRILKELTSSISSNYNDWMKNIIRVVKRETKINRSILIICESINSVNDIFKELNIYCNNLNLITIIGDDNEEQKINGKIGPQTVIISTNISGRGTDIKLDKTVLDNGGLHVIITFIPNNSRVEEQNYGRAGRKGEPGTWQLIINYQDEMNKYYINFNLEGKKEAYFNLMKNQNLINEQELDNVLNYFKIEHLRDLREERETKRLENSKKFIDKVDKEDKLFNMYCNMIDARKELRNEENQIFLDSIEERWAIFLYNLNLIDKSWSQVQYLFNNFKNEIIRELNNGTVIKNPGYYNNYVNKKLAQCCEYEREKSKLAEVGEFFIESIKNIGKALFGDKESPEYEKYIEKCNLSIKLDSESFIPYYLRGFCKILNGEEGLSDFQTSSKYIEKEINTYRNFYQKFRNININVTFIYNQMNLLHNIKIHILDVNISHYKDLNASKLKINKKKFDDIFSFNQKNDDDNTDRKIPKYLIKYFESMKSSGLTYFFFIKEKASLLKIGAYILAGLGLIALSICTYGIAPAIVSKVFLGAATIFGTSSTINGLDYFSKGYEDDKFPDSYDLGFFDFLKKRKKIRKYEFLDINEISTKYDNDYQRKKDKEDEDKLKKEIYKKFGKLKMLQKKEEDDNENYLNKINKKKAYLKKNLNKEEKKCIIGNQILSNVGKNILTDDDFGNGDIHQKLQECENGLKGIYDNAILGEVKKEFQNQIDKLDKNNKKESEEIDIIKQKFEEKQNKINNKVQSINNKYKLHKEKNNKKSEEIKIFNQQYNDLNNRQKELNNQIDNYNQKVKLINNGNNVIKVDENEGKNLNAQQEEIQKVRAKMDKKREELKNGIEEVKKEGDKIEEERKECQIEIEQSEAEKENIDNKIKEFNKKIDYIKKEVEIANNLKIDDLELKEIKDDKFLLNFKKSDMNLPELNTALKKVENDCNNIFQKALEDLSKNEIEKEQVEKINILRNECQNKLEKIVNEKNFNWDNCFNKSFFAKDYIYNIDDVYKIVNFNLKDKKDVIDFKYLCNSNEDMLLNELNNINDKNKIIFGNFFDEINQSWSSFSLIPNNNSYLFLFKDSKGRNPPDQLLNFVKKYTNNNYISKINKKIENKSSKYSEVDAIENIKIIVEEICQNKDDFIKNFENFSFFKEDQKKKEDMKKNIYPNEFIKSEYDEIKERNNTTRIPIGLFSYYFTDRENKNRIDIDFLNKIYEILQNYDEISKEEKKLLKEEYNRINDQHFRNKFYDNNFNHKENLEEKDSEESNKENEDDKKDIKESKKSEENKNDNIQNENKDNGGNMENENNESDINNDIKWNVINLGNDKNNLNQEKDTGKNLINNNNSNSENNNLENNIKKINNNSLEIENYKEENNNENEEFNNSNNLNNKEKKSINDSLAQNKNNEESNSNIINNESINNSIFGENNNQSNTEENQENISDLLLKEKDDKKEDNSEKDDKGKIIDKKSDLFSNNDKIKDKTKNSLFKNLNENSDNDITKQNEEIKISKNNIIKESEDKLSEDLHSEENKGNQKIKDDQTISKSEFQKEITKEGKTNLKKLDEKTKNSYKNSIEISNNLNHSIIDSRDKLKKSKENKNGIGKVEKKNKICPMCNII